MAGPGWDEAFFAGSGKKWNSLEEARKEMCGSVVSMLRLFCALTKNELEQAVLLAAEEELVRNDEEREVILKWAREVHRSALVLQYVLCGAYQVRVSDKEVYFTMLEPEEAMARLVKAGIAREGEEPPWEQWSEWI